MEAPPGSLRPLPHFNVARMSPRPPIRIGRLGAIALEVIEFVDALLEKLKPFPKRLLVHGLKARSTRRAKVRSVRIHSEERAFGSNLERGFFARVVNRVLLWRCVHFSSVVDDIHYNFNEKRPPFLF